MVPATGDVLCMCSFESTGGSRNEGNSSSQDLCWGVRLATAVPTAITQFEAEQLDKES